MSVHAGVTCQLKLYKRVNQAENVGQWCVKTYHKNERFLVRFTTTKVVGTSRLEMSCVVFQHNNIFAGTTPKKSLQTCF